jgi:signal transduction histidine kinase
MSATGWWLPVAEVRGGLRLRLTLAICGVSLVVAAGSFFALREATGADLRDRIDQDLSDQLAEFHASVPAESLKTPREVTRQARRFIASQGYHANSRIFAVQAPGQSVATNEPELLEREHEDEGANGAAEELGESGLLAAPDGFATISGEETGKLRVLSAPVRGEGRRLGTFRVADSLRVVEDAQSGLNRAFVVVGLLALLISAAVALAIATIVTRPLRRMARVASAVGEDDLKVRIGGVNRRDEIGVLADAFDRMLDRLERAFGRQREFVSDASHELRTPLTILRGQVELLDRETDPKRRRLAVEAVLRELDRMNRLVEEMLTLAASESTPLVHPEPIKLTDFVEDLRRDLPLFGDRAYAVTGAVEGTIDADPERLHQVLRNLVRNAVTATEPGDAIEITITVRGDTLEFAVSDHGPGIPPEELGRVFDRFHRTIGARDRGHGGTGLGLAIAQAIVHAHGGWIGAESDGRGTTVRFGLPGYVPGSTRAG